MAQFFLDTKQNSISRNYFPTKMSSWGVAHKERTIDVILKVLKGFLTLINLLVDFQDPLTDSKRCLN